MDKPLELLRCPPEILCHIIKFVNDRDLSTFRLTCKQLSACALKSFALAYFTERKHIVSRYSIVTLLRITAHPVFGCYVKAIILYAPLPRKTSPFYNSPIFKDLLMMIFENMKNRNGAVILGLSDRYPRDSFGWIRLKDRREIRDPVETAGLIEKALLAAKKAACPIQGVKLDLHRDEYQTIIQESGRGAACPILASFSAGLSSSVSPDFDLVLGPNHRSLKYTSRDSAMTISQGFFDNYDDDDDSIMPPELELNFDVMCYKWASIVHVTRLRSKNCSFTDESDIKRLIGHNAHVLISLQLENCQVDPIGPNLEGWFRWSDVFKQLSSITCLRHCRFEELLYGPELEEEVDLEANPFTIRYPNGETRFELEGADLSARLQELAVWTASQEERTSAEWIESEAGYSESE